MFRTPARARYALDAMPLPMFVHGVLVFIILIVSVGIVSQGPGTTDSSRYQFGITVSLIIVDFVCGLPAWFAFVHGMHLPWRHTVFAGPGGPARRGKRKNFERLPEHVRAADDDIHAAMSLLGTRHSLAFWFYGTIVVAVVHLIVAAVSMWAVTDADLTLATRITAGFIVFYTFVDGVGMLVTFIVMLGCPVHTECIRRTGAQLLGREVTSVHPLLPPAPGAAPVDADDTNTQARPRTTRRTGREINVDDEEAPVIPTFSSVHTYKNAYQKSMQDGFFAQMEKMWRDVERDDATGRAIEAENGGL